MATPTTQNRILGLGLDLVEVTTIAALLAEPGTAFAEATFTPAERATAARRPSGEPARHLAARYAAKEALVKALSHALAPAPLPAEAVRLVEAEVVLDGDARPRLALSGTLRALAERAGVRIAHLSLTHDGPMAAAVVVLEGPGPAELGA